MSVLFLVIRGVFHCWGEANIILHPKLPLIKENIFLSVRICGGPGCATHWDAIGIICRLNVRPHRYAVLFLSVVFFCAWLLVLLSDVPGMNIDNLAAYLSCAGL